MTRYHVEYRNGERLTGVYAYPTRERAEQSILEHRAWENKVDASLLADHKERLHASLCDLDCNDSIPETIVPQVSRSDMQVVECHETECLSCLEAGLVEPWDGLVW